MSEGLFRLTCTIARDGALTAHSVAYWVVRKSATDTGQQQGPESELWESSFRGHRLCGEQVTLNESVSPTCGPCPTDCPQFTVIGPSSAAPGSDHDWRRLNLVYTTDNVIAFGWDTPSGQRGTLEAVALRWRALAALASLPSADTSEEASDIAVPEEI